MTRRSTSVLAVVAMLLGFGLATPAQAAAPFDHGTFAGEVSFDFEDCGLALHSEVTFRGVSTLHIVRGSGGTAFLAHDTFKIEEVITLDDDDPATTESVTVRHQGNFREQHATHVTGNIWRFEAIDAGIFFLYGSDGRLLARSAGVVDLSIEFDTLGDQQPGGIPLFETELVVEHGPKFDNFCELVVAYLT